ncbi:ricin-type beta-trefoil lectin domain protein [Kribbella sp. NPDC056861]|uniref:ricin-type beta-trefoil lectin domain protein n=1 Tax=Kribbella sp. NPDC056861 TaxID=3154857 RepID=UPI00344813D3
MVTQTAANPPAKSSAKKPTAKKPVTKKPAAKKPATKKPAVKKPATKQPASAAKRPAVVGDQIIGFGSGRCVDIANAADGRAEGKSQLQLWDCNGAANQGWTLGADGTIRSMGLCMDLAWGSTDDGTQVRVEVCHDHPAQRFSLNNANDLVNIAANKCVAVNGAGNGARLVLRTCAGTSDQKWRRG